MSPLKLPKQSKTFCKGLKTIDTHKPIQIKIDKAELLRFLGYQDQAAVDKTVDEVCDACIETMEKAAKPGFLYSYFDIEEKNDGVLLCGSSLLLKGKSISRHLEGCHRAAVFCLTLSNEADKIIMQARFDVLRQLILDAAASVYVEQLCDLVCQIIKSENENLFLTERYGIGYGDLPLYHQQELLTLLNAPKRLGLMATEEGILTPRKSVTAIIGLSRQERAGGYTSCDSCLLRGDCNYLTRGEHCGK